MADGGAAGAEKKEAGVEWDIVVDDLTFSYDTARLPAVLRHVSLRIEHGARVLVVGDNGAGM
jgi:ABC-type Mn2+/Zn2+ transport system ATPase subunit